MDISEIFTFSVTIVNFIEYEYLILYISSAHELLFFINLLMYE